VFTFYWTTLNIYSGPSRETAQEAIAPRGHRAIRFVKRAVDRAPTHRESRRRGGAWRKGVPLPTETGGYDPSSENSEFFHLKILHSDAFSYTNSKGLFAIKCREKYVITVFLAVNTDMRTSNFHQSRKVIPIQSASTNLRRFHSYSKHVLCLKSYELQTQAAL